MTDTPLRDEATCDGYVIPDDHGRLADKLVAEGIPCDEVEQHLREYGLDPTTAMKTAAAAFRRAFDDPDYDPAEDADSELVGNPPEED
jgi:hypothetical protein